MVFDNNCCSICYFISLKS